MQTVEELERQLAEARANSTQTMVGTAVPVNTEAPNPYAVTTWGESEYDFRVPSGQLCRMRKLQPEELVGAGMLDQLTKLPGIAQEAIDAAEGARPIPADAMPDEEQINSLLKILDVLLPMVVVIPTVHPSPAKGEPRVPGQVYVSDIELADRIAILERATGGVNKFDAFRKES